MHGMQEEARHVHQEGRHGARPGVVQGSRLRHPRHPDYFGQPTAQFRLFQDRTYGFIDGSFQCTFAPKKFVTVTTCATGYDGALKITEDIKGVMVNYFKCEAIGDITYSEAQNGPAKDNAEVMAKAAELGKKL